MGFAFKENVSDIRNTKIFDLYKILNKKKYNVDIHDPLADLKEVKQQYNIDLIKKPILKKYDSIVFTLPHKQFLKMDLSGIKKFKKNIIIIQIKKIFNNKHVDFTF